MKRAGVCVVKKLRRSKLIFIALFALDTAIAFGADLPGEKPYIQESMSLIGVAPTWLEKTHEVQVDSN